MKKQRKLNLRKMNVAKITSIMTLKLQGGVTGPLDTILQCPLTRTGVNGNCNDLSIFAGTLDKDDIKCNESTC